MIKLHALKKYSSPISDGIVPEIWTGKMLVQIYKELFRKYHKGTSTDYEGEIKKLGSKIKAHMPFGINTIKRDELTVDKKIEYQVNLMGYSAEKCQYDIDIMNKVAGNAAKEISLLLNIRHPEERWKFFAGQVVNFKYFHNDHNSDKIITFDFIYSIKVGYR